MQETCKHTLYLHRKVTFYCSLWFYNDLMSLFSILRFQLINFFLIPFSLCFSFPCSSSALCLTYSLFHRTAVGAGGQAHYPRDYCRRSIGPCLVWGPDTQTAASRLNPAYQRRRVVLKDILLRSYDLEHIWLPWRSSGLGLNPRGWALHTQLSAWYSLCCLVISISHFTSPPFIHSTVIMPQLMCTVPPHLSFLKTSYLFFFLTPYWIPKACATIRVYLCCYAQRWCSFSRSDIDLHLASDLRRYSLRLCLLHVSIH